MEEIQTHPLKIIAAGQNLLNISTYIVEIILLHILFGLYCTFADGPYDSISNILVFFLFIVLIIALYISCWLQIRKAGKNLLNSFTTSSNRPLSTLKELEFQKDLLKKHGYDSKTIIEVADHCPACNQLINDNDIECSSCGIKY